MNEENLRPLNQRNSEDRQRIAAAGGKASGEARRQRKKLAEAVAEALEQAATRTDPDTGKVETLQISNIEAIAAAAVETAKRTDPAGTAARRFIADLFGEVKAAAAVAIVGQLTPAEAMAEIRKYREAQTITPLQFVNETIKIRNAEDEDEDQKAKII